MKFLLLAAGFSAAAVTAQAAPLSYLRTEPTEARVPIGGVNFDDQAQVRALHSLLARKSAEVCNSNLGKDFTAASADRACAREALDRVVARIDRSLLTEIHLGLPITGPGARIAKR